MKILSTDVTTNNREALGNVDHVERDTTIPARASYSPVNAEAFRGVFDKMILTKNDQEVRSEIIGKKPNTLYLLANDALKFLADNDSDRNKYRELRDNVRISKRTYGIKLYFRKNLGSTIYQATVNAVTPVSSVMMHEVFEAWLATAQSGDIFDSATMLPAEFMLSQDDQEYLFKLLGSLEGTELQVKNDRTFRVMR